MIHIVVPGAPVGEDRPRFVRCHGPAHGVVAYTLRKTANYEAILAAAGIDAMNGTPPLDGPLMVRITAFMPIAKSWTRKKTADALDGAIRPDKPDADNILKTLDALNGIVWRDDAQIAEARVSKLYDTQPRLEIEVQPIDTQRLKP